MIAFHRNVDDSATGRSFNPQLIHLASHLFLHLLSLFHHLLDVETTGKFHCLNLAVVD